MKIKRKPLTPEQQKELDDNWEYMCSLILSKFSGKLVTPEEYEQEKLERQERDEKFKRHLEQQENINSWKQLDFETINTLLIKYKETNNETYFNQAWERMQDSHLALVQKQQVMPTVQRNQL